jgi:hypothetical protein
VLSRRAAGLRPALLRYAQKSWFVMVVTRVFRHRDTTLHPRYPQRNSPFVRLLDLRGRWLTRTTRSGHPRVQPALSSRCGEGAGMPKYYLGSVLRDICPSGRQRFVLRDINASSFGTSVLRDVNASSFGTSTLRPSGRLSFGTSTLRSSGRQLFVLRDVNSSSSGTPPR